MRRALLPLAAVSLSLIIGGCGSSGSSSGSSPLAAELSYFPAGSPFVAVVATDPHGAAVQNVEGLLGTFPLAKLALTALESRLRSPVVGRRSDVKARRCGR